MRNDTEAIGYRLQVLWPNHKRQHCAVNGVLCGSVVEHCVSSAKGCGFDSQGTHILMKMYNLNAIVSRFG